jgi:hypothetical protein
MQRRRWQRDRENRQSYQRQIRHNPTQSFARQNFARPVIERKHGQSATPLPPLRRAYTLVRQRGR